MVDLKAKFENAVQEVQKLPDRLDNETLLKLYALYKQATLGDVFGKRPGGMDFVGRAKYDAWSDLKGSSKDEAMKDYAGLVDQLTSKSDPE
jgi:diazepam-binding inhibitor (GABA receptor modulating acyl-CoA-binding protein)